MFPAHPCRPGRRTLGGPASRPMLPDPAAPLPTAPPATPLARYLAATRTATYGFLAALPLLVLYEVAILAVGGRVRVGADVWSKNVVAAIGGTGWAALGAVVLLIGVGVLWWERGRRPPLVPRYFGMILVESLIYAVVLAGVVATVVGALFALWPGAIPLAQMRTLGLPTQLALSLGAGLYEELVFRVLLVGGLYLGLRRLLPDRMKAYAVGRPSSGRSCSRRSTTSAPTATRSGWRRSRSGSCSGSRSTGCSCCAASPWRRGRTALYDVLVVTGML